MDDSGSAGFIIILAILVFYFLPSIIGKVRNCAHVGVIFAN